MLRQETITLKVSQRIAVIMSSVHNLRPRQTKDWKKLCYGEELPADQKLKNLQRDVLPETYYIERLIAKKDVQGQETQYLVKWRDYPTTETTWEPERHIDADSLSNYLPKQIHPYRLQSAADAFEEAIQNRLKRGNRISTSVIRFELDVYRHCFQTDQEVSLQSCGDITRLPLSATWNSRIDKRGNGQEIRFPMILKPQLRMEKVYYRQDSKVNLKLKPVETMRVTTATWNFI